MEICRDETKIVAKFGNILSNVHFGNLPQGMKINTAPDKKMFLALISFFRKK